MVVLTGNVGRDLLGRDGFQEADITGITLPITKHNYLVMKASDIAYTVREAFHIASTGRRARCWSIFPRTSSSKRPSSTGRKRCRCAATSRPSQGHPGQIKRAAKVDRRRRAADHPRRPGRDQLRRRAELRAFAEKAGIPVLTTFLGIGGFPQDHVLSYSWMGMHGAFYANHAANEADVVIGIGMRFDDRAMGRFRDFNPTATIIHIDIDPAEIGKNFKTAVPIVGDVKAVLGALIEEIEPNTHLDWIHWMDKHARGASELHPAGRPGDCRCSTSSARSTRRRKGEAVMVTGVGQHQMWTGQHYTFRYPRQLITSGGLGTMGFEVPAALGAQMARPDKVVWSICGDGGFQMTMQELATIVDQRAPVKFAIMNNGFLGMVRQWQELFYDHNYVDVDTREGLCQPDFVKLAEAYGIKALRVDAKEDARAAIDEAMAYDGPVLLEFVVEPEGNVWPMVPAGASLAETLDHPDDGQEGARHEHETHRRSRWSRTIPASSTGSPASSAGAASTSTASPSAPPRPRASRA